MGEHVPVMHSSPDMLLASVNKSVHRKVHNGPKCPRDQETRPPLPKHVSPTRERKSQIGYATKGSRVFSRVYTLFKHLDFVTLRRT